MLLQPIVIQCVAEVFFDCFAETGKSDTFSVPRPWISVLISIQFFIISGYRRWWLVGFVGGKVPANQLTANRQSIPPPLCILFIDGW